jgi:hypothetical protein
VTYHFHRQALDLAPVAQIARDTPYGEPPPKVDSTSRKLMSIPGIVHGGPSLTLRFDHAYLSQFLGRNVRASVGLVNAEAIR